MASNRSVLTTYSLEIGAIVLLEKIFCVMKLAVDMISVAQKLVPMIGNE